MERARGGVRIGGAASDIADFPSSISPSAHRNQWSAMMAGSSSSSTARSTIIRSCARNSRAEGVRFRTTSDTEVLLHLYARHGADMLHRLRGMFAFAIWDSERRGLFLARDLYGIKPLYTANDGWTFRFASQVKALLAGGGVSRDPEPAGSGRLPPVRQRARAFHLISRNPRATCGSLPVDRCCGSA